MRKLLSPAALVSALALVVSACSNEAPTSPNLNTRGPSLVIGVAAVGQAQVCLANDAPTTLTYSAGFTYSGDASNDTQAGASQALLPGGCVTALLDQQPGISPSPIAWVNSTLSVNQVGGSWSYSCVVTPDEITISDNFCPNPYSGSGNVARTGESAFHGSTITFHYTPAPPVITEIPTPLFVIGDVEPHGVGTTVNFWGSQWWKNNFMSGFVANGVASFKGYATEADNVCGGTWVARPGNSGNPPNTIPSQIAIIVTPTVNKVGPNISGTISQILIVNVQPGYSGNPGHWGNGVVTSIACPAQAE